MTEPPDLWAKARERLPDDVREWLSSLEGGAQQSPIDAQWIDSLISQAQKKHEELEKNRHNFSLKAGKHKLELRPLFENMIKWIDKFKGIGDVVSSFDPVHAALPWAAFRFVLQHLVAGQEHSDKFVRLLASMPRILFTGRIFELVYTKNSMHLDETQDEMHMGLQSLDNLHQGLVELYSGLLSALQFCYSFFSKSNTMRKVAAVFNSSKPAEIIAQLEDQHKSVVNCGDDCKRVSSHRLERKYLGLLEDHQTSLGYLNNQVSRILVQIDEQERLRTLRAISNILFRAHHQNVSDRRTVGTCDWITSKEEFIEWMKGDSSVVVLYGIPGAGKTFLTSRVIDFVIKNAKSDEAVAFFYCKRDDENRRNPQEILRSILRQLSSCIASNGCRIHPALKGLPDRLEAKGTAFDVRTCKALISDISKDYSKTTIILDALDECERDNRWEIMDVFDELVECNGSLHIFLSSRTDDDIRRHFQSQPIIEIQTTDNEEDISVFVEDRLSRDKRWHKLDPSLRQGIKQTFRERSQGMFQWAALQMQQLNRLNPWNKSTISNHLKTAPRGLKAAYDVVWEQIQDMPWGQPQLAERAFLWLLCTFEPLQTAELSLVMQLDPNCGDILPDKEFDDESVLSICGNLLVKNQQTGTWSFCHLSAQEYVENKPQFDMINAHRHAATCSLKFLLKNFTWNPEPPSPRRTGRRHADERRGEWRLNGSLFGTPTSYPYYILHLTLQHAEYADSPGAKDTELGCLVQEFLRCMENDSSSFLVWTIACLPIKDDAYGWSAPRIYSRPLETITTFGIFFMLESWWREAVDNPDNFRPDRPSILSLAIKNRHEHIWQFLMQRQNAIVTGFPPPLIAAIQVNSMPIFNALIDAGADVNGIDHHLFNMGCRSSNIRGLVMDTPLKAALFCLACRAELIRSRHINFVFVKWSRLNKTPPLSSSFIRELLANKAIVDMRTDHGSALELAARKSTTEVILMLLDRLQIIPRPNYLLFLAAGNAAADLESLQQRLKADTDCEWEGTSPLMHALHAGNAKGVRILLKLGERFKLVSKKDMEAVCSLTNSHQGMELGIFSVILSSGLDVNANNGQADLLFTFVALRSQGTKDDIKQLINAGAIINRVMPLSPYTSTLAVAAAKGEPGVFRVLLDAGADPTLTSNFGIGSPLASAAFHGQFDICLLLLAQKAVEVNNAQGGFFRNVLFALITGHMQYLSLKSGSKSSIDPQTEEFGTYFHGSRHLEVLRLFFENNLDIYMPIYCSLNSACQLYFVDQAGYELTKAVVYWERGHIAYFPLVWFAIACELQDGARPQIPIRDRLRQLKFPTSLPLKFTLTAQLKPAARGLARWSIALYSNQASSGVRIISRRQNNRQNSNMWTKERRWRRYVPRDYGVVVDEDLQCQVQLHPVYLRWASSFCNDQKRLILYGSVFAVSFALFLWYLIQPG